MNAKSIHLNFNTPFPTIDHAKEAIQILAHTILLHRSTGHFKFGVNDFTIESIGIAEESSAFYRLGLSPNIFSKRSNEASKDHNHSSSECQKIISPTNIQYHYIRINCEDLNNAINSEIETRLNINSTQLFLNIYQVKLIKNAGMFTKNQAEEAIWEQYKFNFSIDPLNEDYDTTERSPEPQIIENIDFSDRESIRDTNPILYNRQETVTSESINSQNYSSKLAKIENILGSELAKLSLKILTEISCNQSYIPQHSGQAESVKNIFYGKYGKCQPYLFKFSRRDVFDTRGSDEFDREGDGRRSRGSNQEVDEYDDRQYHNHNNRHNHHNRHSLRYKNHAHAQFDENNNRPKSKTPLSKTKSNPIPTNSHPAHDRDPVSSSKPKQIMHVDSSVKHQNIGHQEGSNRPGSIGRVTGIGLDVLKKGIGNFFK